MSRDRSVPVRTQLGETLIETLVSILILSLVAVAAYAGLTTSITSSAQHRDSAVAETMLRTAAERVQDPTNAYLPLAGCGEPPAATYDGLPTWPTGTEVDVTVRFWNGQPGPADQPSELVFLDPGVCPSEDPGLQLIELSVGSVERLDVLKRSNDAS